MNNQSHSYAGNLEAMPKAMGATDYALDSAQSINALENTITELAQRLDPVLAFEATPIGGTAKSDETSTGSTLGDAIAGNDRRVRECSGRLQRLIERLRV